MTSLPGPFRFDVCPYMREIVDCLSVDSPIREVSVMKGAQVTATTAVLENTVGYCIDAVKTAPCMLVTADAELAQIRMESYITPMLHLSGLMHLIKSADEGNARKRGKTDKKLEWLGGGFLIPFGAQNANKLRSISIQFLFRDEIDGWPETVGKDGDPIKLSAARTAAYESSRKILDLSTPLIKGISKIEGRFREGDQRRYHVCCLRCGFPQVLRWRTHNAVTGEDAGVVWDTDAHGRVVPDSVRYRCENCGREHINDEKHALLRLENGAEWRAAAVPTSPHHRSYHLSALYSPVGMQSWEACARAWTEAWDDERGRPRDMGKLQVFYNNILGEPFELRGEKLKFEQVSSTRRTAYCYGQVPNKWAIEHCGSPVLLVTAAADVHKNELPVAVIGWCRDGRGILLDYWRFEGDTEQLDDPGTWGQLRKLLERHEYVADDGKRYHVALTLVDSGYRTDTVYRFCGEYASSCFPAKGREGVPKGAAIKHFAVYSTPQGTHAFHLSVDLYKDTWSAALRRAWDGTGLMPAPHLSAPMDAKDEELRELTVEVKREKLEKGTGRRVGFEWHRPSGAANELWDLLIYNHAALDITCWDVCRRQLGLDLVNWPGFWDLLADQRLYFTQD